MKFKLKATGEELTADDQYYMNLNDRNGGFISYRLDELEYISEESEDKENGSLRKLIGQDMKSVTINFQGKSEGDPY